MSHFGYVFNVTLVGPEALELFELHVDENLDGRVDLSGGRLILTAYAEEESAANAFRVVVSGLLGVNHVIDRIYLDDDLVAISDIAVRLGVSRQAVQQFATTELDFPVPFGTVASTRVWRWAEVNKWLQEHRADRADEEHWPLLDEAIQIDHALAEIFPGSADAETESAVTHPLWTLVGPAESDLNDMQASQLVSKH